MSTASLQSDQSKVQTQYPRVGLFIDGEWIYDRETAVEVRNPATEEVLGQVPKATRRRSLACPGRSRTWILNLARHTAPAARQGHPESSGFDARATRSHRHDDHAGERQALLRCLRGSRPFDELLRMECGAVTARLRVDRARRIADAEVHSATADRTRGRIYAVERADQFGRPQSQRGFVGGVLSHSEGGRRNARYRMSRGEGLRRCGACRLAC